MPETINKPSPYPGSESTGVTKLLVNALKGMKAIHEEMKITNELLKDHVNILREIQSASLITETNTIRILDILESKTEKKGSV